MPERTKSIFDRLCANLFEEGETQAAGATTAGFARFRLLEELGRGGMGVVWKAYDPTLDREVALKILPPTTSRAEYQRLLREARAPSRAPHPGIVKVHEMGEAEGRPFIVMDLVGGRPLTTLAGAPLRKKVEAFAQLAEALDHAHRQGVVHRDIKPSNILITGEGLPVLVDFGLSRTIGRDERVTQTGAVFGTPYYMSPEQADGSPADVDARSDVYGLGVVMYELLSGKLPFAAPTPFALIQKILSEEPARIPGIPPPLEAIVLKTMAKRKEDRFPSANDLARELRAWLAGATVKARIPARKTARARPPYWIPIALGALFAAVAAGLWIFVPPGVSPATSVSIPDLRPSGPPVRFEPHPWRSATRAALFGDAETRAREVARLRDLARRAREFQPRDSHGYILEARLLLLEGREKEALDLLELGSARGAPEDEMRIQQCVVVIATSQRLAVLDQPYRIDGSSLLKDERFVKVRASLSKFSGHPFVASLERMIEEKETGFAPEERRPKPPPPEMRLILTISRYSGRRPVDPGQPIGELLEDFPTPGVGAVVALHVLSHGRLDDAKSILDQVDRLGRSELDTLHHLKALIAMEKERFADAEAPVRNLKNEKMRRYLQGLICLHQGKLDEAKEHFSSLQGMYQAEYHLACARAKEGKVAIEILRESIKHAVAAGEYDILRGDPPQQRYRIIQHAIPFFVMSPPFFGRDRFLQPLRDNPQTRIEMEELGR